MTKSIPLSQGKFALVDDDMFDYLMQWKWSYRHGYAYRKKGMPSRDNIHMHRVIMNTPDGMQTDHINGDGLDNRRANLRICTDVENKRNKGLISSNTSGYKGVSWNAPRKQYQAYIKVNNKVIFLGRYPEPESAGHAYDEAAKKYFGEFARLNFPE